MGKSGFHVLETVKKLRVRELTLNCFIGNISISSDVHGFFCIYLSVCSITLVLHYFARHQFISAPSLLHLLLSKLLTELYNPKSSV